MAVDELIEDAAVLKNYLKKLIGAVTFVNGELTAPDGTPIAIGGANPLYPYKYDALNLAPGAAPIEGEFIMNSINVGSVTKIYIRNTTTEGTGIGNYLLGIPPGMFINIKDKASESFGRWPLTAAVINGGTYKEFTVGTLVNGIDFADNAECIITFDSVANAYYDPLLGAFVYNNDIISHAHTEATLASAVTNVPITADTDNLAFIVRDPGGNAANRFLKIQSWALRVDFTDTRLMMVPSPQDFCVLARPLEYKVPNVVTWTVSNNGGKVRLTAAGHGLTLPTNCLMIMVVKSGTNWTANQVIGITAISGNNVDTDFDYNASAVPGNPTFTTVGDSAVVLSANVPAMRSYSRFFGKYHIMFESGSTLAKNIVTKYGNAFVLHDPADVTTGESIHRSFDFYNQDGTSRQYTAYAKANNSNAEGLLADGTVRASDVTLHGVEASAGVLPLTVALEANAVNDGIRIASFALAMGY